MNKSQNTISLRLIIAMLLVSVLTTGCQIAKLPKMPDMAIWKKDVFRLSKKSKSDNVAPPSRHFDPEPSHLAVADSSGSGMRQPSTMSSQTNQPGSQPIREPYKVDDVAQKPSRSSGFGFPENSKSLTGNSSGSEFSLPDAQDFRSAMNGATQRANEMGAQATQAASNAFSGANDFVANQNKRAGDFAAKTASVAQGFDSRGANNSFQPSGSGSKSPASQWKQDFQLPKPELQDPRPNQFAGSGSGTRNSTPSSNSSFQPSNNLNQSMANSSNQFEKSWDDSVKQAQQATRAIRENNPFPGTASSTPNNSAPKNEFSNPNRFDSPAANQFAGQHSTAQPANSGFSSNPNTFGGNQGNSNSQFASTGAASYSEGRSFTQNPLHSQGSFEGYEQASNSTTSPNGSVGQPASYPATNFAPYSNTGRESVSQVTPINDPIQARANALAKQNKSNLPAARTAGIPTELLQGNGSYAPGSVRSLSPIRY